VSASAGHGQRLSPIDGSFLRLDSPQAHMHVGWSAVFAEPGDGERPTIEALRERVAGRLHEAPFCRWRLQPAPLGLSEPRWVDDPGFDVAAHVTALTEPNERVSYDAFAALRDAVLSEPLDRSRPLWQILLVPCLQDGRVGLLGKVHHALVDGIAALQVAGLVVDGEPDATSQAPEPWHAESAPGNVGWARDALTQTAGDGLRALRATAAAATRPRAGVRAILQAAAQLAHAAREDVLPRAPACALNVPIGGRRCLVGYRAPRAELRAARSGGGTLNDVGLAVVAGALRALALVDGDAPEAPLKAMVPVSMRPPGEMGVGNRISLVSIQLPVDLASPAQRLEWVREQTRRLKHSDRPAGLQTLYRGTGLIPPPLRSPVARAMASPRAFNVTVSQSPGPRGAIHMLGCELEEVYSVVPIAQGHALAIGMVRYQGDLFFGCHADPDALPGVHALPALLDAERRALGGPPRPSRPRAARAGVG